MKILLVEDEKRMAQALCQILHLENYEVDHCADGISGLEAIETDIYDIIILDVMLPKMNGFDIAKKTRQKGIRTPILMLTAKSELDDKVVGLDSGADDYLVKPFAFEELLARIRVMLRKHTEVKPEEEVLSIADLSMDLKTHKVFREGNEIELSSKEFAMLEYLLRNQGKVLSRDQIEQHVWNYDYMGGSNMVDVYIRYLRKKIDEAHEKKLIHTVRGAGYVLRE